MIRNQVGAVAFENPVALDIFNPPRQDWIDDAYLRGWRRSSPCLKRFALLQEDHHVSSR